ncbi:MAG: FAD-binding oxidoreductase [Burkholderiales bacterium]|nr:FAD-binding oxidoreductase [Burkholderiales bacterium]
MKPQRIDPGAQPALLASLRAAFAGRLITDPSDAAPFLRDWRGKWTGRAIAIAQPDTTADAASIVAWCAENAVAVVPQGGNTGLSGGSVPESTGLNLVLSTSRLNKVRLVDSVNNVMVVEAGVTLQQVQEHAEAAGRFFPLSLAAQGSCTIGGNLSTNAGGVQVLRYGNIRDLCLGLEVVTAGGQVWDGLRALRKDNTGYDLRGLFIGSEGTLGVITAAVLKLFPPPAARAAAFAAVPSPSAAAQLLQLAQEALGPRLTAFELLSEACLGLVLRHIPAARRPLDGISPWYALLEASGENEANPIADVLTDVLGTALEEGAISDAAVSSSVSQFRELWALRENISESQAAEGRTIKHDISLPISAIPEFIESTSAALGAAFPGTRMVVFGHLGDGNLHFNLSPAPNADVARARAFEQLEAPVNQLVHDAVAARGGSISAEHGLGVLRRDEAARYKTGVEIQLMRAVKNALDPLGTMNPAKVLSP